MQIIHALPPALFTLQMILLKGAPASSQTEWDLQALRQCITVAELCARSARLKLGTKLDALQNQRPL